MFKVGDKVRVTKIVHIHDSKGSITWCDDMDDSVGKVFTINYIDSKHYSITLKEFKYDNYLFPVECIVKTNHNYDKLLE